MSSQRLDGNRLIKIVDKLKKVKALVVGDVILDHYIIGDAERLSPEAPVPVVWARSENYLLGGATNVSHNIAALGAKSYIAGVIGNDFHGKKVQQLLKRDSIKDDLVIIDKSRPTTLKTRVMARHQQMVRIDWESREFLSPKFADKILDEVTRKIPSIDAVIIEDYGKGVINPELIQEIVALCRKHDKIVTVDPKEEHIEYYKGVTSLTPNLKEAQGLMNFKVRSDKDLDALGEMIVKRLDSESLLITLGEKGMKLFMKNGDKFCLPTYAQEVFDVSGAGDTVIAVFSLALATGASFQDAAAVANMAAGIVVGKLGVAVTDPAELKAKIRATC
jgi:D-glycero-beta-D-manno-heptose-7-phosphate kinase